MLPTPAKLDRMAKCLTVNLPEGWEDATHLYENATFSFRRALPSSTGLLQVMIAEYQGGEPPNPTEADLIDFAVGAGNENHGGEMVSTFSGSHKLGVFWLFCLHRPQRTAVKLLPSLVPFEQL